MCMCVCETERKDEYINKIMPLLFVRHAKIPYVGLYGFDTGFLSDVRLDIFCLAVKFAVTANIEGQLNRHSNITYIIPRHCQPLRAFFLPLCMHTHRNKASSHLIEKLTQIFQHVCLHVDVCVCVQNPFWFVLMKNDKWCLLLYASMAAWFMLYDRRKMCD